MSKKPFDFIYLIIISLIYIYLYGEIEKKLYSIKLIKNLKIIIFI